MINKSVRIITVSNTESNLKDINFIIENLQSVGYSVSKTRIGLSEDLLIREIERSIKFSEAVLLICERDATNSIVVWKAISEVFHQSVITDGQGAHSTTFSKRFEQPELPPVMYLQGLYVLDFKALQQTFSNLVLPILENVNAKLVLSRILISDEHKSKEALQLLPQNEKVSVAFDVSLLTTTYSLHLSSTSMSALLDYETLLIEMLGNADCDIGSDLSELVYNQRDLHIRQSVECIEECFTRYSPENVFVSFNGGKDCTVLLHLIIGVLRKNYPKFAGKLLCLYVESSNPFPELNRFINECQRYYNLDILTMNKSIKESLGLVLEMKPNMKGVLMGTRRTDPFSAHLEAFHMTDKNWPQVMRISPLLDWHYSQIWDYLLHLKVPYCSLYDAGYTSLGSATNTVPNPFLVVDRDRNSYLPAYKLLDGSKERSGRKT